MTTELAERLFTHLRRESVMENPRAPASRLVLEPGYPRRKSGPVSRHEVAGAGDGPARNGRHGVSLRPKDAASVAVPPACTQ